MSSSSEKPTDVNAVEEDGKFLVPKPVVKLPLHSRMSSSLERPGRSKILVSKPVVKLPLHRRRSSSWERPGRSVNAVDGGGQTPLHIAVSSGDISTVKLLLDHRMSSSSEKPIDINAMDGQGQTPLHIAASKGVKMIEALLDHKMSSSGEKPIDMNAVDRQGQTPLHIAASRDVSSFSPPRDLRRDAKMTETARMIQVLLDHMMSNSLGNPGDVNAVDKDGQIDVNTMDEAGDGNAIDKDGQSDVNTVDEAGDVNSVDEAGDVNAVNKDGQSDVNVVDEAEDGQTPLHVAVSKHNVGMVKLPLHHRMSSSLERRGVNAVNQDGETPLHIAVSSNDVEAVRVLLDHMISSSMENPIDVNAVDKGGRTPLHIAASPDWDTSGCNLGMVKVLLEHRMSSSSENPVDINAVDSDGQTPLHVAVSSFFAVSSFSPAHLDVVNELLHHGANPCILDKRGHSVTHLAASFGSYELLRCLLNHEVLSATQKFSINAVDENDSTILHLVAGACGASGTDNVINLLLDHDPNVDVSDKQGNTALEVYLECGGRSADVVKKFREHGAYPDKYDKVEIQEFLASVPPSVDARPKLLKDSLGLVETSSKDEKRVEPCGWQEGKAEGGVDAEYDDLTCSQTGTKNELEFELFEGLPNSSYIQDQSRKIREYWRRTGQHTDRRVKKRIGVAKKAVKHKCSSCEVSIQKLAFGASLIKSSSSDKSLRADALAFGFKDFEELFDPSQTLFIHFPSEDPGNAGAVEIIFFHHQGMAALFGVVVQFAKVVLKLDCDVEVHEVGETIWTDFWIQSNNQVGSLALLNVNAMHFQGVESLKLAQEGSSSSISLITSLFGSLYFMASGGSGGSTRSGAIKVEMNDSGNSDGGKQLHVDSESAKDVDDDHKVQHTFTVDIYLDSSSEASEYQNENQEGTKEEKEQEQEEIKENLIEPVISIIFYKNQDSGTKWFITVVNLNYFMKCDVNGLKVQNRFGWYHDELRLSFKCMEVNAANIGERGMDAEYKTFQQVLVGDRFTTKLEGRLVDVKLHVGSKNVADGALRVNWKKESTDCITERQENTSSILYACVKCTNFVITPEGGPSELAYLARSADHYNVWDDYNRQEASRSGRMSNVPIKVWGDWRVTDNLGTTGRLCKYQFEGERTFIKMQRSETPIGTSKLLKWVWREKKIMRHVVSECRIKQKITKTFEIDHKFALLDRLKVSNRYNWGIADTTEAPKPISDIINASSSSSYVA